MSDHELIDSVSVFSDDPVAAVPAVLKQAVNYRSSDIHIEPGKQGYTFRLRIDGKLRQLTCLSTEAGSRLLARIKVLAGLDTTEKRAPQDGRFHFNEAGSARDCRLSTCPTVAGEKAVIRLLDPDLSAVNIHCLGMTEEAKQAFSQALSKCYGLILVTGPTGSGKSMTLYSALNQLNDGTTNIMTLEDPVEIGIAGVNQTNINPAIGLDFATLLRALLRQDPDIIMIGEIRDSETAEITVKAAQTGHLVLATIHAQDTLEAFARLHYLGINLHDSLRAVKLIMAQRLVRQVCIHCDGHKAGCLYCFGGYYRRTGLFECLPLTVSQQLSISTVSDLAALNQQLAVLRSPDLLTAASQKVAQGVTTQHEIDRVL